MTDEPRDPEIAELAARLDAERPRPGRRLRRRVGDVLARSLRERVLRRQSVWLVASGSAVLLIAAVLAATAPS